MKKQDGHNKEKLHYVPWAMEMNITPESRQRVPPKLIESFEKKQGIINQSFQAEPRKNQNGLEEKLYVIENLLEKRFVRKNAQYLVKWKGYGNENNTCEPKSSLPRKIVNRFEKELQDERRAKRNGLRDDGKHGDVKMMEQLKETTAESVI